MPIQKIDQNFPNIFGIEVDGKVSGAEVDAFVPQVAEAVKQGSNKLRLLIDVTKMHGANVKAEWEMFDFLKHHIDDVEFIAVVGAHSWVKFMSEIFSESIFNKAETLYFESKDIEHAWEWLQKAMHPKNQPVRRFIDSDKGLFTKYSSPDYI